MNSILRKNQLELVKPKNKILVEIFQEITIMKKISNKLLMTNKIDMRPNQ